MTQQDVVEADELYKSLYIYISLYYVYIYIYIKSYLEMIK